MQTSTVPPVTAPIVRAPALSGWSDFLIGLALTAVVPAIFWVATIAGMASLAGYETNRGAMTLAGLAIAGFLGVFFAVFAARRA